MVYELHYVPCKELISTSIIIKTRHSLASSTICLNALISIIKFNPIFRDVYREVGLLDVISSLLIYHAQQFQHQQHNTENESDKYNSQNTFYQQDNNDSEQLLDLTLEISSHLMIGPNNQNCTLFNECGAVKHVFKLISNTALSKEMRKKSFFIIQQLILSNQGEEHLAALLALMHRENDDGLNNTSQTASSAKSNLTNQLALKASILNSLLVVLRDSHRVRALFRKVGGFVYVMSVLVHMEGSLAGKFLNQ